MNEESRHPMPEPPGGAPREPSAYARRRQRRLDRWRRPIDGRGDRIAAWANMLFVDHGIFRLLYLNAHPVGTGAWRSAQPAPHQIRRLARLGVRSVVSLRGGQSFGSLPLEIEACRGAGLAFETFVLRSRALPSAAEIEAADALFRRIERPVLFHCKSGADRAGFMAGLWLMLAEGRPLTEAAAQLSLRFGHIRQSRTGVLDAFFAAYAAEQAASGIGFRDWVRTRYDREAIVASVRPTGIGRLVNDWLLDRE